MPIDERAIRSIYENLINGWNTGDAAMMTRDFSGDASMIGFDGSEQKGRVRIEKYLASIFADHQVAAFVTLVREIRPIGDNVAMLRAHAGMVPPGTREIKPDRNAVQTLVAARRGDNWYVELFQNTPAAWHGRAADVQALTNELRAAYEASSAVSSGSSP